MTAAIASLVLLSVRASLEAPAHHGRFGYEPPAAATASSGRIFRLVMISSTAPYRNSGRGAVLVNKAAQHVPPADVRGLKVTNRWPSGPIRRPKIEPAMGPLLVVVRDIGPKDTFEVSPTKDERPVQAFGPEGAHPAFAERVGVWGANRHE